ncbi:hypothetical protein MYK68_15600 [Gordonia sp. PP30]|uniref:hypothetical protein n=1 Tax=Gordonia sp. PP30 TaxID=2935861 RepID=UPI001FFF0C6C|nr:hypothetical protein [Gordonia sp. PP30]UQE74140.1 hypothetical protein MYK68_15600 [Gordonia sp. PP30]
MYPPGRSWTVPAGFGAAIAFAVAFVLLRGISQVLQISLQSGKIPVETEAAAKTLFIVMILLPIFVVLPAVLWMARGPRVDGRPFATACGWTAVIVSVEPVLWVLLPPNPQAGVPEGIYFSGGTDFIAATLILIAWIVTRRGSAWSLLIPPIGGIIALQAVKLSVPPAPDAGPQSMDEQIADMLNPSGPSLAAHFWYPVLGSTMEILVLVGAAWLAFGVDKGVEALRGPLPMAPAGMLTPLTANQRRALTTGTYGLLLGMLTAVGAMVYSSTEGNMTVWALATAAAYVLVGTAASLLSSDPGPREATTDLLVRRLLLWLPLGIAALCLVTQFFLMLGADADAAGRGAGFGAVYHLGLVALAAAVIGGISKGPWGTPAAFLLFIPSTVALGDYADVDTLVAKIDASGKVAVLAVVFVAAVILGVLLNKATEYVLANPETFRVRPGAAVTQPPRYGPTPPGPPPAPPYPARPHTPPPPGHRPPSGPHPPPGDHSRPGPLPAYPAAGPHQPPGPPPPGPYPPAPGRPPTTR